MIHEEEDFECDTGMDDVSQCSCVSVGVMWSLGLRSFIRRAAVCRTEDMPGSRRRPSRRLPTEANFASFARAAIF